MTVSRRELRLPLQLGTSSAWSFARAALSLVPGLLLVIWARSRLSVSESGSWWLVLSIGLLLMVYALMHLYFGWRSRPSDGLIGAWGVRIEGGRHHGLALAWDALDPSHTAAETRGEARISLRHLLVHGVFLLLSGLLTNKLELAPETRVPIRRLTLAAKDGRSWQLAEAELPAEQRSLDAFLGSIRAKLGTEEPAPPLRRQEVLVCAACGGPAAPEDLDSMPCRYCSAPVVMPPDLRARLRASRAVAESLATAGRAVEALLDQRGARAATLMIATAFALALSAWCVLSAALFVLGLSGAGVFELGWTLVSGWLLSAGVFVLARAGLANRRALRLLTSSFGARAPSDPRGSPECRRCGGGLPASHPLIAACAFCGAENVLGLDSRSHVAPTEEHALSLTELLAARSRERRLGVVAACVASVVAAFALLMAAVSWETSRAFANKQRDCARGSADACLRVARDFGLGISGAKDEGKALEFELRACQLGSGEACFDASRRYRWGWGTEPDLTRAAQKRREACERGFADACKPEE